MACANCCGTCCAVLQFSGFEHPVPAEMFAWFQELGTGTLRNVNFFSFNTAAYQLDDGTYVKAVGVVSYDTAPRLDLTIQVFEPVQYVPNEKSIAYYRRHYNYSYRNTDPIGDKIINPCTHSLIEFLPAHVFSRTVTNVAYVPDVGSELIGSALSIPAMSPAPAPPVPSSGGTFRIGMGRNMDSSAFYVEGDNWIHNIDEVVVELSSEIVGNDTFSNNALTLINTAQVFPVTYEFALQRAASPEVYSGLPLGSDYIYSGGFNHAPYVAIGGGTSTNAVVRVRLARWPACGFNGQLFAIALQLSAPFVGVSRPGAEPLVLNATYTSATHGEFALFHENISPLGINFFAERPRGIFYGSQNASSGPPLSGWWHKRLHTFTEAGPILRRRLRKCDAPPCDPVERFEATGSVQPIFPPQAFPFVVSPENNFALPNAWTGRLYRTRFTGVTDTSEFVTVKCKLRILSVS